MGDGVADGHGRVEVGVRVLEDRLHPAPERTQVPLGEPGDVAALELDPPRRRLDEPQHRPPERRLAAAALPDDSERLPAEDLETDAVDRPDDRLRPADPPPDGEVHHQIGDPHQRPGVHRRDPARGGSER